MAVKLADTLAPMGDFEIAEAKDISVNIGGTKKMLQKAIEDGDIGGASDIVVKCTEDQYGALLPDQKALNIIYCTEKNLYYHDETIVPVVDTTPITDSIGSLESLKTTEKTNLVGAINEVSDSLVDLESALDDKADASELGEKEDKVPRGDNPSDKDLDTYTSVGRYSIGSPSTYSNVPITDSGILIVENSGTYKMQMYITESKTFVRRYRGTRWDAWQELATMDKVGEKVKINNGYSVLGGDNFLGISGDTGFILTVDLPKGLLLIYDNDWEKVAQIPLQVM